MTYQYFQIEDDGEERIVSCKWEELGTDLEVQNVGKEFSDLCSAAIGENKRAVILDLGGVRSMASSMLGKLLYPAARLMKREVSFRIRNVSPLVAESFVQAGLYRLFDITEVDGTLLGSQSHSGEARGDTVRVSPEQSQHRRRVFEALEQAGFRWMEHFKTLDLDDGQVIEVCGIQHEHDARAILQLLGELVPTWHRREPQQQHVTGWRWQVAVHRDIDPDRSI